VTLPYAGVASFMRAPLAALDGNWHADVGVLGVPFDLALGFRPGARFAPRAIREASLRYAVPEGGFYDLKKNRTRLKGLSLRDAGDVDLPSLEPELARERTEHAAAALRQRVQVPIFLGGDHSVTYPLLRAFHDVPELHVVQFDAHLDFSDSRNDTRFSNSSPFRRAVEALPNLVHITTLGLRGLRFDAEAVSAARARGHVLVPVWELADLAAAAARLPVDKNIYLSFDVDAFDPALLPATSSPEVEGLSYTQAMYLVRATLQRNTLVGMDLVEFTPQLDVSGSGALLLARLLAETLAEVFS
jgi:agmatinase